MRLCRALLSSASASITFVCRLQAAAAAPSLVAPTASVPASEDMRRMARQIAAVEEGNIPTTCMQFILKSQIALANILDYLVSSHGLISQFQI
jgi:hypothetical protein